MWHDCVPPDEKYDWYDIPNNFISSLLHSHKNSLNMQSCLDFSTKSINQSKTRHILNIVLCFYFYFIFLATFKFICKYICVSIEFPKISRTLGKIFCVKVLLHIGHQISPKLLWYTLHCCTHFLLYAYLEWIVQQCVWPS